MEKEFIPFELAVKLKALGFDKPCFGYYDHQIKELDTISSDVCERLCKHDTHIKAPTFSQAFRWFREKYKFDLTIQHNKKYVAIVYSSVKNFSIDEYKTHEEAELDCLKKLIEIVKSK